MRAAAALSVASLGAGLVACVLAVGCPASTVDPGCVGATCDEALPPQPPRIYVDPPFGVGFDCVTLGCEGERRLVVENRGGGTVKIALLRLSVDASGDFELFDSTDPDAPLPFPEQQWSLGAGETRELTLRYVPSDSSADTGKLWIDWYDGAVAYEDSAPARVELPISTRALGVPTAVVATQLLNFGYVAQGATLAREVVVENPADATGILEVGPITLEEGAPAVFGAPQPSDWETTFLNPGESRSIPVVFAPTGVEASVGGLLIATNDPTLPAMRVILTGTSIVEPRLELLSPVGALDFANVRRGESGGRSVVVRNLGGAPLELSPQVLAGAGLSVDTAALVPIAPLEVLSVPVLWAPTAGGPLGGQLQIAANDPTLAAPVVVEVVGFCDAPNAGASPGALDLGDHVPGWIAQGQSISISNTGTGELTITDVNFELGTSSQFSLIGVPALPVKLSPGEDPLVFTVGFAASQLGSADGAVLITHDGVDGTVTRVPVHADVLTCDARCPTANGTPNCGSGACEIASCNGGFHDPDGTAGNGCECSEDVTPGTGSLIDVSGFCPGRNLGEIGDDCAGRPNNVTVRGTLHSATDVDLYFVRALDRSNFAFFFGCDETGDSFDFRARLVNPMPGLQLCVRAANGAGCGGENQRTCVGAGEFRFDGSFGDDDDRDATMWVEWAPGAPAMCGSYELFVRAND